MTATPKKYVDPVEDAWRHFWPHLPLPFALQGWDAHMNDPRHGAGKKAKEGYARFQAEVVNG